MSLDLKDLSIFRGERMLVPPLSHRIEAGEVLSIMGPSGAGKSTLLAAIAGSLDTQFSMQGEIWLNGQRIDQRPIEAREVGIIFQDALLFPHLSVGQNLAFGMPGAAKDKRARIEVALDDVGLSGFFDRDPATLSGGEAARVALQRALLAKPKALLLDEPFSKLDQNRRAETRALTFDLIKEQALPAILVTHDAADAKAAKGEILSPFIEP